MSDMKTITFDEFCPLDDKLDVEKFLSLDVKPSKSSIVAAAKSMRRPVHKQENACYTFSLSKHQQLDKDFHIPEQIFAIDLYQQYWPVKELGGYLQERSKLFYGFQAGHISAPFRYFGGMSKWFSCLSGFVNIYISEPTKYNLTNLSLFNGKIPFKPEPGTTTSASLRAGDIFKTQPGFIVVIEAKQDSFLFSGEFLTYTFDIQIECLEEDAGKSKLFEDRAVEFRTLYLIVAAKLASMDKKTLRTIDLSTVECLKIYLSQCKKRCDINCLPKSFKTVMIIKDFVGREFRNIDRA